jgi:hypothetical protein
LNVGVKSDRKPEPDEVFCLEVSDPTNALLGDASGTGTILNDD